MGRVGTRSCSRPTLTGPVPLRSSCLALDAVFVTSYLMLGLQLAAKYLEDPFGYDLVDLDLDEVRGRRPSSVLALDSFRQHCRGVLGGVGWGGSSEARSWCLVARHTIGPSLLQVWLVKVGWYEADS